MRWNMNQLPSGWQQQLQSFRDRYASGGTSGGTRQARPIFGDPGTSSGATDPQRMPRWRRGG